MAKRRKNRSLGFNIHKFITLGVVILALSGIGLTVYASQQKTQTESDASTTCEYKPKYLMADINNNTVENEDSIIYHLRTRNDNSASCGKNIYYDIKSQKPSKDWKFIYTIDILGSDNKYDGIFEPFETETGYLLPKYNRYIKDANKHKIKLKVIPPPDAPNITYYFKTKACYVRKSDNGWVVTDNCSIVSQKYIKTKNIDRVQ